MFLFCSDWFQACGDLENWLNKQNPSELTQNMWKYFLCFSPLWIIPIPLTHPMHIPANRSSSSAAVSAHSHPVSTGQGLWAAEQHGGAYGTHPKYISQLPTATQHSWLQDVKLEAVKEPKIHHFLLLQRLDFYRTSKYTLMKYTEKMLVHKNVSIDIKCTNYIHRETLGETMSCNKHRKSLIC